MSPSARGLRALLLCAASLLYMRAPQPCDAQPADDLLSGGDEHLLRLLAPAARGGLPGWQELHLGYAAEVEQAKAAGGLDVVVYGDSIMEAFRGRSVGMDASGMYGANRAAWQKQMEPRHKAAALAIAGDQMIHLLWRLHNGEGPEGLNPRVITIMIGTNDVGHLGSMFRGNDSLVGHIIQLGVQQCVSELRRQAPQARIVVLGLLPLQPDFLDRTQHMFDGTIQAANIELERLVRREGSEQLRYKDCGSGFLHANGTINHELMPDGVHPAGAGAAVLLQCLLEAIESA